MATASRSLPPSAQVLRRAAAAAGAVLAVLAVLGLTLTGPDAALAGPDAAPAASPSSASVPATTPSALRKTVFTVGVLHDVDSLNPFRGSLAESYEAYQLLYDQLSQYGQRDFAPSAQLATSVSSTPDGRRWTYTIRPGVLWSDGEPLTAYDVAYTLRRIMKGRLEQINWGSDVANILTVDSPDKLTLVITTKAPTPLMTHLTVPILPAHIWSPVSEAGAASFDNEPVVGSGPFEFVDRQRGSYIRFRANKHYWGGAPTIDELVFRVYDSPDAMALALTRGEIDFADGLSAAAWNGLRGSPGITTYAGASPSFEELGFNTGAALDDDAPLGDGHPALRDVRVRQALNYALDRPTIVKRVLDQHGAPGSTVIPPLYAGLHLEPPSPYTFDLARASAVLDAAGYRRGPDGIRTLPSGGGRLSLRLFARQSSQESQQTAALVRGWFRQAGVEVQVSVLSEAELTKRISHGEFDLFLWGWVVEPDPDAQLSSTTCSRRSRLSGGRIIGGLSDSYYCNRRYDALYAEQAQQINPAARAITVKKAQQLLYDDAPYAVLYYPNDLQAYRSSWTGFLPQPSDGGVLLFQWGSWSYQHIQPLAAAPAAAAGTTSTGNSASGLWVVGGLAAALAVAAIAFPRARRRREPVAPPDGSGWWPPDTADAPDDADAPDAPDDALAAEATRPH